MYRESEVLELKREVSSNICKEIIAFANTNGGTIYIGYDDNGNIVGINNVKEEFDKLSNIIFDSREPNIIFNISMEIVKELEMDIIVIKILKGNKRPYYLKSKGMTSEGVYLRLGATNKKATRDEIIKIIIEDNGINFEDNISKEQNLTFRFLKLSFQNIYKNLDKIKMQNLGLINKENIYTNLAYILSDQNPYSIKFAIYNGNTKEEFLDKIEFENMSVLEQIYEIDKILKLNIKTKAKIVGMKRVETYDYSIEAIRECLYNAIIHRDYSFSSNTLINFYQDYMEITNIGNLMGGLTIESITKGSSANRNPKLASIFHRLEYVESYGSGIPRIMAKYKNQNNKPNIEVIGNNFYITIPKLEEIEEDVELKQIIGFLNENKKIARENVEKILECSKTTAIRKLNKYLDDEIIKQISVGKNTYYELN